MRGTRREREMTAAGKHPFARMALACAIGLGLAVPAGAEELLFWSNQAQPDAEAQAFRDQVLSDFGKPVRYSPQDPGLYLMRIQAERQAGLGSISVIGGLHGDFASFPEALIDLHGIDIGAAKPNAGFVELGKLGTREQKYLPWMQAGYVMVATKGALAHLPEGADVNALTYRQLIEWGRNMREASSSPKLGLPAGPKGLLHRFLQGFLYPSYTKSVVTRFRSPEAEAMWNDIRALWAEANPASLGYDFMQEPLAAGEVWVAWDHVARLKGALNARPDDFVVFPTPAGPLGRGFMPVLAGLGVPKTSPDIEGAKALVAYLMRPETQVATLRATAFFPVVEMSLPADVPRGVRMMGAALAVQAEAEDGVASLLPVGLRGAGSRFNAIFTDAFRRIVVEGEDTRTVLDQEAENLRAVMAETRAPCWAPDPPSPGPCPVD